MIGTRGAWSWAIATFAAFVLAQSAAAQEEPLASGPGRVVVEGIGGPQGASYRSMLVAALREAGYEVLGPSDVHQAAEALGIPASDHNATALGAQLHARAFISGGVARTPRSWSLSIRVRNANGGASTGGATWSGSTMAALGAMRRNAIDRLQTALGQTSVPTAPPPEHTGTATAQATTTVTGTTTVSGTHVGATSSTGLTNPHTAPTGVTGTHGSNPVTSHGTPTYAATDSETPGQDTHFTDSQRQGFDFVGGDHPTTHTPVVAERYERLAISISAGSLHRSLGATITPVDAMGMPTGPDEPRTYQSGGVGHPEVGATLEIYPGAFGRQQVLPYVGLVASYHRSVFVTSHGCTVGASLSMPCPSMNVIDVGTTQQEVYIGARGRYRIGDHKRDPMLIVDMGYGYFDFSFDSVGISMLAPGTVVPSLGYSYFNLGAAISYGVVPTYLTVQARGGYRLGLGVSQSARDVWGTGASSNNGYFVGFDVRSDAPYLMEGLFFAFSVDYFVHHATFDGDPTCIRPASMGGCRMDHPEDPWPLLRLPEPVKDAYIRLAFSVGFALE